MVVAVTNEDILLTVQTDKEMATRFLATLLQTYIRHTPLLTHTQPTPGPVTHTYAAAPTQHLPQTRRPPRIPTTQPAPQANLPCARCLTISNILGVAQTKYPHPFTIQTRGKPVNQYLNDLPPDLQTITETIFSHITGGNPNHTERIACPFSPLPTKRALFSQSTITPLSDQEQFLVHGQFNKAIKVYDLCVKCGKSTQPEVSHLHTKCSSSTKNCPPVKTQLCRMGRCTHNGPPLPSLWQAREFILHPKTRLLQNLIIETPFH